MNSFVENPRGLTPRFDYRLLDVAEVRYRAYGYTSPYDRRSEEDTRTCICRARVYEDGPDRPFLVISEHVIRSGGGNLAHLAVDAARAVAERFGIPIECLLWVNRLDGTRGSYSRKAERFSFVDLEGSKNPIEPQPHCPTTRKAIESRFGIVIPDAPKVVEARQHPVMRRCVGIV